MLTAMHAKSQIERLQNAFLRASRFQLWAAMIVAVPIIGYREEIFRLYVGDPCMSAATVVALLMASYPFVFSTLLIGRIAIAKGEMKRFSLLSLFVNLLNVAITLVLVGVYDLGAIGAASGSLITRVIAQPILYWPLMGPVVGLRFGI
jgi:Na+-driven multidrug efflux pump